MVHPSWFIEFVFPLALRGFFHVAVQDPNISQEATDLGKNSSERESASGVSDQSFFAAGP